MMESDDFTKILMIMILYGFAKKRGVREYWYYCWCNSLKTGKFKRSVKLLLFLLKEDFSLAKMFIVVFVVYAIPDILIVKRVITLVGCSIATKGDTGFIMKSLAKCLILVAAKDKNFQKEVSKY